MKLPRKKPPEPIFTLERKLFPWRKAEIYESKHLTGKYQLWKLTCDWEPYDDLDYITSETVLYDTLQLAIIGANEFINSA